MGRDRYLSRRRRGSLRQRRVTLLDHLQDLADGHLTASQSCLVGLQLERLIDRELALGAVLGDRERFIEDDVEGGVVRPARFWPASGVAGLPILSARLILLPRQGRRGEQARAPCQ